MNLEIAVGILLFFLAFAVLNAFNTMLDIFLALLRMIFGSESGWSDRGIGLVALLGYGGVLFILGNAVYVVLWTIGSQ